MTRDTVEVRARGATYPVRVGAGLLGELPGILKASAPAHHYAVIADGTVAELYGRGLVEAMEGVGRRATLFSFPPGEASKTRAEWARLTDELLDAGLGRDGAIVALGGGVTGDLAGFVAATFMRGLPLVQVPTSLLAMVDASVGGKTGVDARHGKNLVGAFHAPTLVVSDPDLIRTLPRAARAEGLVEAVKHGAILDLTYLRLVEDGLDAALAGDPAVLHAIVSGSVVIKGRVVAEDERERGWRKVLNFGHTLGHGLEAASDFQLGHGAAVALGMILEARLGERLGVTEEGTARHLSSVVARLGLAVDLPTGTDIDRVLEYAARDKKAVRGAPRYVLLERVGQVARGEGWVHPVSERDVRSALVDGRLARPDHDR